MISYFFYQDIVPDFLSIIQAINPIQSNSLKLRSKQIYQSIITTSHKRANKRDHNELEMSFSNLQEPPTGGRRGIKEGAGKKLLDIIEKLIPLYIYVFNRTHPFFKYLIWTLFFVNFIFLKQYNKNFWHGCCCSWEMSTLLVCIQKLVPNSPSVNSVQFLKHMYSFA